MKSSKKFILNCMVCLMVIGCIVTTVPKIVEAAQRETVIDMRIEPWAGFGRSGDNRYTKKILYFNRTFWKSGEVEYDRVWRVTYTDIYYKYLYETR